jgi:Ran GTPase-activating protein (RanGAP) involved in mRNA processing and transport
MSSCTYKYDALAAEVKLKHVTSCRHNRALLHRIKNNDPGITYLSLVSDGPFDEVDFVVRENDDLGIFGYFVGQNKAIKDIYINHLPADKCRVETMFEGFQKNTEIASVHITGEGEDFLHKGFSAMNLPHVTHIHMEFSMAPEGAKYLALALHRCKSLKRYSGHITVEIAAVLSTLPMLEWIGVFPHEHEHEAIPQDACAALGELVKTSTAVKELWLIGVGLGDEGLEALAPGLNNNRSLTTLHLGGCNIGDQGAAALASSLAHTPSLEILLAYNNNIGDEGVEALASALSFSQSRSRLRSLSLDGNTRISARGFGAIARFLQSRKCTVDNLNLNRINIGEEGGAFLGRGLSSNKSLLTLSLRDASIDNVGLRNLVTGLSSNNSLQNLDLSSNTSITAVGLSHFKHYFQSSTCSLQVLDIYSINIGDEGALALVDALAHSKSLKELGFRVESSGVSVTGLQAFSKLLCDFSAPNNAYVSNHTLRSIGDPRSWNEVADEYLYNISLWLEVNNVYSSSNNDAAKIKVLCCFLLSCLPDLMTPLFQWDLKLLPFVKAWFQQFITGSETYAPIIQTRELSAIYSFVRGMPVWVADDYKQYLPEQLNKLDATNRKLQEEIHEIEEVKRHLLEG